MLMTPFGLSIAVLGYVITIVGTWRLFHGAPEPQLPGLARIGTDAWVTTEEKQHFDKWKASSRWAQPAIVVGSSFQLIGTVLMWLGQR